MILEIKMSNMGGVKKASGNYSNCPLKKRPIKYELDDDPMDSDSSSNDRPMDLEPENLSTKPQDLRISSLAIGTPNQKSSPPPLALVAGHRDLNGLPAHFPIYTPPAGFKAETPFKISPGPLEPLSLNNAPSAWQPHIPPYLQFNYSRLPHHLFSPPSAPASNFVPLFSRSSPPHASPPLEHLEPAYPVIKREVFSEVSNIEYATRDSVISHTPTNHALPFPYSPYHSHHRDSMSSGRSSCDSGVASPTSSSHSASSSCSVTPTNVNGSVRYPCPNCTKSYSTYSGLSKHIQFHCASQNKQSYTCKYCPKVYTTSGALKMHIKTHTLPCKCDLCGKCFSRPWLLQGHIRTHTGEKPFACNHCNRAFADRSNLRAHLQTHSEVKKYSCKNCSKTFSRMSLLTKHYDSGCVTSTSSMIPSSSFSP